jgi:2-dehydropantoate 2-reductase
MAGTTASRGSSIGPIVAKPEGLAFFRALMEEARAVGKAEGVEISADYIDSRMKFLAGMVNPDMKASMAHDLERGNRLELDWLAGYVVRLGRDLKVPTPVNESVYKVLKLHRMGVAGA